MRSLSTRRVRAAIIGATTAVLAIVGTVLPAAAAMPVKPDAVEFWLTNPRDPTTFVDCPQLALKNIMWCGYGLNVPMAATSNGLDAGLSGTVMETFASALAFPVAADTCVLAAQPKVAQLALTDYSAIAVQTARGKIFMKTTGSFCMATGADVEPFQIVGGTGDYEGATGYGKVTATAGPMEFDSTGKLVTGYASETYHGFITRAHR